MIDKILANLKSGLRKTWFATWEQVPLSVNDCTFFYTELQKTEVLQRQHVPLKLNILCATVTFITLWFYQSWNIFKRFWNLLSKVCIIQPSLYFYQMIWGTGLEPDIPSSSCLISQLSTCKDSPDFDTANEHRPVGMCLRPKILSVKLTGISCVWLLSPFVARFPNSFGTHI